MELWNIFAHSNSLRNKKKKIHFLWEYYGRVQPSLAARVCMLQIISIFFAVVAAVEWFCLLLKLSELPSSIMACIRTFQCLNDNFFFGLVPSWTKLSLRVWCILSHSKHWGKKHQSHSNVIPNWTESRKSYKSIETDIWKRVGQQVSTLPIQIVNIEFAIRYRVKWVSSLLVSNSIKFCAKNDNYLKILHFELENWTCNEIRSSIELSENQVSNLCDHLNSRILTLLHSIISFCQSEFKYWMLLQPGVWNFRLLFDSE